MSSEWRIVYAAEGVAVFEAYNIVQKAPSHLREWKHDFSFATCMVTRHRSSSWLSRVITTLKRGKGRFVARTYRKLCDNGIPVPSLFFVIEQWRGGFYKGACMGWHFIFSYINLRDCLGIKEWWKHYIPSAAGLLKKIHDRGFFHGDFNTANILFDERGRVYVIDILRTRRLTFPSLMWRVIDMLSLELTHEQYRLFLFHYGWRSRLAATGVYILSLVRRAYKISLRSFKWALERYIFTW